MHKLMIHSMQIKTFYICYDVSLNLSYYEKYYMPSCRGNENTICAHFFSENRLRYEIMWKIWNRHRGTDGNITRPMRCAC